MTHADDEAFTSSLRAAKWAGWPLGSDWFMEKVEVLLGMRLRALPHGRPRTRKKTDE